jgi:hypothetical protein
MSENHDRDCRGISVDDFRVSRRQTLLRVPGSGSQLISTLESRVVKPPKYESAVIGSCRCPPGSIASQRAIASGKLRKGWDSSSVTGRMMPYKELQSILDA